MPSPIPTADDLIRNGYIRRRRAIGTMMALIMFACAALSVFVTTAIVVILVEESWMFFREVPILDFLTGTMWTPVFTDAQFGVLPLLVSTLQVAFLALLIAIPMGTVMAIYLSEYASTAVRETIKPALELLEAVPTVVYGYFALIVMTPFLQKFIPGLAGINLLVPSIILGIMILPYVVSVSEDAMRAVPNGLREGAYALGMSRWQVAFRVVLPGAMSGVTAAYILGMSRAVGETMVVAIAAGQNPNLTFDPREGAATITAYIVQMSLGDLPRGTLAYSTIFSTGLLLFVITLMFNIAGFYLRKRFREVY
ncbi:phosphate ABC transporter membrane protein 1, PhoT family [Rubellimicrobium thermophilum DSM 16684]|uniref:Phosphate transport system permease protein n=1 Tax=Rubellimicrobium thermophilum DSM 16684 TaxID=1123069 RepID=S9QUC6_9RHOB|nr:phosphate ABC transporter permease subunit PstC [Rubellimicrobium thermophilum]EPX83243.1 phosphate ABC transporter membrane protein 1, PhoT family [Rubellimicrobium thermophilum DSM 16684]